MRDEKLNITIKNCLRLTSVPLQLRENLIERLKFPNPKYIENSRMGRWNRGVPRELRFYHKVRGGGLVIPRGYIRHLVNLCRSEAIKYDIDDRRRSLPVTNFLFNGNLRPFQQRAVDHMLSKEFGTLSSPTGSGKTIMALYIVAKRQQPALIGPHP